MATPLLGEIRMTASVVVPKGWARCDGQLLPINQNQALFSLLGTTYGGDGKTTFALPDLRGRVPLHRAATVAQGASGGEEAHALTQAEMPAHTHSVYGSSKDANQGNPEGALWAGQSGQAPFAETGKVALWPGAIDNAGAGQPHDNMAPFLTISFMIALAGEYPSRD